MIAVSRAKNDGKTDVRLNIDEVTFPDVSLVVVFPQQKKVKMNVNKFVNPYNSRSNGGIPIFSQERILERARKVSHLH